ncbi:MAG: glycosyltransferase family 2 protein [Leptospirales bacterium]|jgi:glycosyltransferase involved in cell wall biosynthesis
MKKTNASPAPRVSIVAPMYNESAVLGEFYRRTVAVLEKHRISFEILCVDDGSRDDTALQLRDLARRDRRIKLIRLSRNFGKDVALSAGLDYAQGEMIVPIDADLQDPPELIPAMLEKMGEGYDVVYARRTRRLSESLTKRVTARLFYATIGAIGDIAIPPNVGDFRVFNRRVLNALVGLKERRRFMKGLFTWVGFRQYALPYVREARAAGATQWNYWKLWNFAIEGITSFTIAPLRIWTYLGLVLALGAFVYASILITRVLLYGIDVPGYASLMVVTLFIGGIQLINLGVLGEYLGRIFEEVKGRPLYIISEIEGDLRPVARRADYSPFAPADLHSDARSPRATGRKPKERGTARAKPSPRRKTAPAQSPPERR